MRHIRKFNEELKPDVYRKAAGKFSHYGKEEKSVKLSDWADLQEFGFYNMHFANDSTLIGKDLTFTKPELLGIYYSQPPKLPSVNLKRTTDDVADEEANKLVKNWVDGISSLSIYFEFGFRPTKETIEKKNHSYLSGYSKGGRHLAEVPAFTISLTLSDWYDGLEDYDSEAKFEAENGNYEFTPSTVDQFYEWTHQTEYNLERPYSENYFAIFADRKSAQKFKVFLLKTLNSDIVKDRIMDVLRVINCSSSHLEEIFKSFNDIKIHGLYYEQPTNLSARCFGKKIDY